MNISRIALLMWLGLTAMPVAASGADAAGEMPEPPRPRVGLVLSGGGARGAAHVGVLKVLKELRVPVDVVAGTSMGAVIGGLYAAGLEPDELEAVLLDIDWQDAFRDRPARRNLSFRRRQDDTGFLIKFDLGFNGGQLQLPKGLIQGQKLGLILRELTLPVSHIGQFDRLPTPFRAVAADLTTGDAVVMGDGDLVATMRASMSVPGMFAPVEIDGRVLVDGGLAKNIPIDVAQSLGVDVIIAVDVGFPLLNTDELSSAVAITNQMLTILIRREATSQIEKLGPDDILLEPALGNFSSRNFAAVAELFAPGEKAARDAAVALKRLSVHQTRYERFVAGREAARKVPGTPTFVEISGDAPLSEQVIRERLSHRSGEPLDPALVGNDAERIFGLGLFEHVDYSLIRRDGELGLAYTTIAKSWGPNYLRFGMSFEEDFEGTTGFNVGARYTRTAVNRLGAEWRSDLQLGTNPKLTSEFYQPLSFDLRYFIAPEISLEQRNLDVFEGSESAARFRLSTVGASLAAGREIGDAGELRVGVRRGTGNARVQIGPADLENIDFNSGEFFVSLRRDTLDDVQFPRSGTVFDLELNSARPGLGSDNRFDVVSAGLNHVRSFGRHTLAAGLDLATTVESDQTVQDFFALGGFLNLSGLNRGELTGPHAGLARLVYYRQLGATGGGLLDWPLYAGMSVEAGNVWQARDDIRLDSLLVNGSLFVGVETFLGPLFFATGIGEDGSSSLYLFLGAPLR